MGRLITPPTVLSVTIVNPCCTNPQPQGVDWMEDHSQEPWRSIRVSAKATLRWAVPSQSWVWQGYKDRPFPGRCRTLLTGDLDQGPPEDLVQLLSELKSEWLIQSCFLSFCLHLSDIQSSPSGSLPIFYLGISSNKLSSCSIEDPTNTPPVGNDDKSDDDNDDNDDSDGDIDGCEGNYDSENYHWVFQMWGSVLRGCLNYSILYCQ